jgi:hypothetical protein
VEMRCGLHNCDYHIYTFVWLCVSIDWDWGARFPRSNNYSYDLDLNNALPEEMKMLVESYEVHLSPLDPTLLSRAA